MTVRHRFLVLGLTFQERRGQAARMACSFQLGMERVRLFRHRQRQLYVRFVSLT